MHDCMCGIRHAHTHAAHKYATLMQTHTHARMHARMHARTHARTHARVHTTQVTAWRCRGRVPLAADVTASLVEARLQDQQLCQQQGQRQQRAWAVGSSGGRVHEALADHGLRLIYALPIIRCAFLRCGHPGAGLRLHTMADAACTPKTLMPLVPHLHLQPGW